MSNLRFAIFRAWTVGQGEANFNLVFLSQISALLNFKTLSRVFLWFVLQAARFESAIATTRADGRAFVVTLTTLLGWPNRKS